MSQFVEGDLTIDATQQVDAHIESCESCQCALERITHDRVTAVHAPQPKTFLNQLAKKIVSNNNGQPTSSTHADLAPSNRSDQRPGNEFLINKDLWPDDYRVDRELGRGGMGIVYEAQQISLGRSVALKVIPHSLLDDAQSVKRFELEARTAAQLQHEHIVPVYEVGAAESYNWYSMRLIAGKGLDQVIKSARTAIDDLNTTRPDVLSSLIESHLLGDLIFNGPHEPATGSLPKDDGGRESLEQTAKFSSGSTSKIRPHKSYYHGIATIGQHVAEALAHAHENGVVHRDIKPSNLLLDQNGKVWVADFGLAKKDDQELTRTGDVVGTLRFLSPERFDGINDRRGDIYSLGMTLYEMLALGPAFDAVSQYNVIEKIRNENPARLQTIDSAIPRDLITIIAKATEKDPARRYASAQLMAEDLRLFLDGRPIRAHRVSQAERLVSWSKRNPGIAVSLATVFTLLVAGLIGSTYMAFVFRDMANEQERLAGVADSETELRTQNLYYAEMNLAQEAANTSVGLSRLRELLNHWIPSDETEKDRRGFEWYWLAAKANMLDRQLDDNEFGTTLLRWSPDNDAICCARWGENPLLDFMGTPPEKEGVYSVNRFNRNGTLIGAMTNEHPDHGWQKLTVWDCELKKIVFKTESEHVLGFDFDPTTDQLVVLFKSAVDKDRAPNLESIQFRVYSTKGWKCTHESDEFLHYKFYLNSRIRFHPDGRSIVFCRFDREIKDHVLDCFSTEDWSSYAVLKFPPNIGQIYKMQWHPQEQVIATTHSGGTTIRWDADRKTLIQSSSEHFMNSIQWHPVSYDLMIAGNGAITMLDGKTLELKQRFLVSTKQGVWAAFSPDGNELLIEDGAPSLIDFANAPFKILTQRKAFTPSENYSLKWSADEKLICSSNSLPLTIWDVAQSKIIKRPTGEPSYTIYGEAIGWDSTGRFVSNNESLLSISESGAFESVGLFQGRESEPRSIEGESLPQAQNKIQVIVDMVEDGKYLVWAGPDLQNCGLAIWKPEQKTHTLIYPIEAQHLSCSIAISPDGQKIAISRPDLGLSVVDVSTGHVHIVSTEDDVYAIAWSKDGQFIATACDDNQIKVIETTEYKAVSTFKGAEGRIMDLDWSPDGERLASGSRDKKLTIWDTKTGNSTLAAKLDSQVGAVAWSPSGKQLASLTKNGALRIWDARRGYELDSTTSKHRDQASVN